MRDLSTQELGFVYGAGASPMPPSKGPKCKKGKNSSGKRGKNSSRGKGSRSGSRGRCGKGGSS